ncbi:hypothetical protein KFE98_16090 [bacterium SCSIO 12741]|nr:hypothetical protein KFE98_16090 [bacterium SCSIO 12741]
MGAIECGNPVLLFTCPDSANWTMLGAQRLMFGDDQMANVLFYSEIQKILPHGLQNIEETKRAIKSGLTKSEWSELTLLKQDQSKVTIHARKGPDVFALWNIILMMRRIHA